MTVTVEFFGVPKIHAGIASIEVEAETIHEALLHISQTLPAWAEHCLKDGNLKKEYILSINGIKFTKDKNEKLASGDSLLIFSADVGG